MDSRFSVRFLVAAWLAVATAASGLETQSAEFSHAFQSTVFDGQDLWGFQVGRCPASIQDGLLRLPEPAFLSSDLPYRNFVLEFEYWATAGTDVHIFCAAPEPPAQAARAVPFFIYHHGPRGGGGLCRLVQHRGNRGLGVPFRSDSRTIRRFSMWMVDCGAA